MPNIKSEDQPWLDTLAGRQLHGLDPVHKAQAEAVRAALTSRRAAIDSDSANVDSEQFDRLCKRLISEGLLSSAALNGPLNRWGQALAWLGFGGVSNNAGSALVATRWMILVIALIGAFTLTRLVVTSPNQSTPADVLRGGTATLLIVRNPQLRSTEMQAGLKEAKSSFEVTVLPDGRIQIDVESTTSVLEYLETQRISPVVKGGKIRLLIQKES